MSNYFVRFFLFWDYIEEIISSNCNLDVIFSLVPNCPLYYVDAKLTCAKFAGAKLSGCQIVRFYYLGAKLSGSIVHSSLDDLVETTEWPSFWNVWLNITEQKPIIKVTECMFCSGNLGLCKILKGSTNFYFPIQNHEPDIWSLTLNTTLCPMPVKPYISSSCRYKHII